MEEIDSIVEGLVRHGGRPYFVGGMVRDRMLGIASKDIDIEVYGMDVKTLISILEEFGNVSTVGVSFGVIKLSTEDAEYDFTLPRKDSKSGKGHTAFTIEYDPDLSLEEASSRRDFTINAMMLECASASLVDLYGGQQDLDDKVLSAVGTHFAEDPLRVLRGFQFAARFDMTVDARTATMCRALLGEYDTLPKERIWTEWEKWALKGDYPSKGLQFLLESGWVTRYPELEALIGLRQDPTWHPEGDVWTHTAHVCDEAADIAKREKLSKEERTVLMFAALCHDLGKATTTETIDGKTTAYGHCKAGEKLTQSFLQSIGCPQGIITNVIPLVSDHLVHADKAFVRSKRGVRRLAVRLHPATIEQLVLLIEADRSGRPPLPKGMPTNALTLLETAKSVAVLDERPAQIIMGRHLIGLGSTPGPQFKALLERCYEAQLDGEFTTLEEGKQFLAGLLCSE